MRERDCGEGRLINSIGAMATGLLVGAVFDFTVDSGELYIDSLVRYCFLGVCSYLAVALLLHSTGKRSRIVPDWILISIVGSMLFSASVHLIPEFADVWKFRPETNLVGYVSSRLQHLLAKLLINSLIESCIAMPTMGLIYYSGALIKWLRRRITTRTAV